MATVATTHHPRRGPGLVPALVLALALFAGLYVVGLCLLWILDPDARPGLGLVVVPVVAMLVLLSTAVAERRPSRRPAATSELASTSRLLALVALLLLVPATLLDLTASDGSGAERVYVTAAGVEARGIAAACPPGRVPTAELRDVSERSPHATAVDCVVWWGITRGVSSSRFDPGAAVTREQAASAIAALVETSNRALPRIAPDRFTDDDRSVHQAAVNRLADAGLISGTGDDRFSPSAVVSRGQLAALLVRAHEHVTGETVPVVADAFPDDNGTRHELAIDRAATLGLLSGDERGRFSPDEPVSRGQLASFLARALDAYVEAGAARPPG